MVRRVDHSGYLPSPEREARAFELTLPGDRDGRVWTFRRWHLAVRFAEKRGLRLAPECPKCRSTGVRPPTKKALKTGHGAGGSICDCAAGKVMHDAWQGLVSPGH